MAFHLEVVEDRIICVTAEGNVDADEFRATSNARVTFAREKLGDVPYALIYDISKANLLILDPRLTGWSVRLDKNMQGVVAISQQVMASVALKLFRKLWDANVDVVRTYDEALNKAKAMLHSASGGG